MGNKWRFDSLGPYASKPVEEAQAIGESIDMLVRRHGRGCQLAQLLVDAAKAKSHPAYGYFERDDKTCGILYRRAQALRIINAIVIVVKTDDGDERKRPGFVSISLPPAVDGEDPDATREYVKAEDALADPEQRAAYLARTVRQLMSHEAHVAQFDELDFLLKAMRKAKRLFTASD